MRIIHVITRLDMGGSAENTLLTVLGNIEHGHSVDLLCGVSDNPPSENESLALQKGAKIVRFRSMVREISPVNDLISLIRLVAYMRKYPGDVLHTHTSKAGILGRLAGLIAGVRCIVHTPHGHIFYGYFSPGVTKKIVAIERFVTNRTSALITLTRRERDDYLERNIGTPETVTPILSGIDLAPYMHNKFDTAIVRSEVGLPENSFIAGTVARLVAVKNHDLIVSAAEIIAKELPLLLFVFVGDGDLHEHLENRIRTVGLTDRFVFLGWRNDTPRLLAAFDCFVMCSHNEGMGRAFVEAQASGLPVIGSRVGGIPEVLIEGETGYLVDPNDATGLAESLRKVYLQRYNRNIVAQKCREWVYPQFTKEIMVEEIEKVYKRHCNTGQL